MKVSGIDKQIVDLIDFMNEKEMKPFASCDGVLEEHEENYREMYGENFDRFLKEKAEMMLCGYVGFMDNDYTKNLLANALDNDLIIDFNAIQNEYEMYGNIISGKTYTIRFMNLNGERTEVINKVVYGTYDKTMIPSRENLDWVTSVIENIPDSINDYFCNIRVNCTNIFTMKNDNYGKHSMIFVSKIDGKGIIPKEFAEYFEKELGLKSYTKDDENNNVTPERSYIYHREGKQPACILILRDEYIEKIPEILKNMFEHEFTITKKEQ